MKTGRNKRSEKSIEDRLADIESKLDLVIDAMGLSDKHRLAPAEIKEMSQNIVLEHKRKQEKK